MTHSMIPILQEHKEHTCTYTHTLHEFLQALPAYGYNWSYFNGNNSDGSSTCPYLLNRESPENNEFSDNEKIETKVKRKLSFVVIKVVFLSSFLTYQTVNLNFQNVLFGKLHFSASVKSKGM